MKITQCLIKTGATADAIDDEGLTAYDWLCFRRLGHAMLRKRLESKNEPNSPLFMERVASRVSFLEDLSILDEINALMQSVPHKRGRMVCSRCFLVNDPELVASASDDGKCTVHERFQFHRPTNELKYQCCASANITLTERFVSEPWFRDEVLNIVHIVNCTREPRPDHDWV